MSEPEKIVEEIIEQENISEENNKSEQTAADAKLQKQAAEKALRAIKAEHRAERREERRELRAERRAEKQSDEFQSRKNMLLNFVFALVFGTTAVINLFKAGNKSYSLLFFLVAAVNVVFGIIYYRAWISSQTHK